MLGYLMIGTNDLDKAVAFYEQLIPLVGAKQAATDPGRFVMWGNGNGAMLAVTKPHDGNPATVGNGVMPAIAAPSKEVVDQFHAKALELGATNEGDPGPRTDNFYGGYFRDLDGNKLVVFHLG